MCVCLAGYTGDPFTQCNLVTLASPEILKPCSPSPCGANAICREQNGVGACQCLDDYFGNPYEGCRPECVVNSDCALNKACSRMKCIDPCPGTCGTNALCQVNNHLPNCICQTGYTGNPFSHCNIVQEPLLADENPCSPSPCGANSQCKEIKSQAVCSCLPTFIGSPPNCRPECVVSSECSPNLVCINQKCSDPCIGSCGDNANCNVINHSPICVCKPGLTGNPFTKCFPMKVSQPPDITSSADPCLSSPCGLYAECRNIGGSPSCACQSSYIGNPPNCRPECTINSECPSNQACINEKCRDPCSGACGLNAQCTVYNHIAQCGCVEKYNGDPFTQCVPIPLEEVYSEPDPCNPSPCGSNALCNNGECICKPGYMGDPYFGCRPECLVNNDCPQNKACTRNKCIDPCINTCGKQAECNIYNHVPMCTCPQGFTGNAFLECRKILAIEVINPCNPSPCGPNSQCREINGQAICTCLPSYKGAPPTCRPECVTSAECALDRACSGQRCIDPCKGNCGIGAKCQVINHNPICSCPSGLTGDPFHRCIKQESMKNAINKALLTLPQSTEWKQQFAKFGIIKFDPNSDGAYDGPPAQMWSIQNEKLNVRYY